MDVLCLGESMIVLAPAAAGPLRSAVDLHAGVAGAESNVAVALARLGARAAWYGKVGDDPLGRRILDVLDEAGVDRTGARTDPDRPTGVYFKDPGPEGTRVHYYRRGSAASTMAPGHLAGIRPPRILHLSGITPALSADCAALVEELLLERALDPALVSFDVNYRPALWPVSEAGPVLARLADAADIAFVGLDEAQTLWGATTADDVRDLLPGAGVLVVKDGGNGVTAFEGGKRSYTPAEPVAVVEPVGAGDAFAAGFLYGRLRDAPLEACMRLGHRLAAGALQTVGDLAPPPPPETVRAILEDQ
ncbi:sugar kinase [Glycomyces sp. TRM65418]|uniref:sugar kinase n=1 Tax=Glycomyces sp. TRM65418 TaxID=2867006 RepID=UPI001CE5A3D7|nr:sugar kinase [Glycomyces sp. TRM65418]MCC3763140.1 sugar kinase [Glycomyces sp. TRM65418]QZD57146.1 sugar kinase [Glycomyces sp. TRM65418]